MQVRVAIRRTVLTASAVSFALLATACGGGESGDEDKKAKGGAGAEKPAAKALSAGKLEKLVVTKDDLEDHEVKKPGKDEAFEPGSVSVEKAECKPVAQALSALPAGDPAATAQRLVVHKTKAAEKGMPSVEELGEMTEKQAEEATLDSLDITKTLTSLWSYDADGAEQALATLRKAGKKCAGGFTMTADGEKQQVTKVTEEKVSAGEDAVAWTIGTKQDGSAADTKVVVFRQGTTLAGFSSFNIASVTRGEDYKQPTALIDAQAAKLG
ncbi:MULTISPECIES: hypothetical protein [unclassified Streptomyces]|uniref:hypothetical protein n=1 Tax=Streptomyces sp. AA1529 TaxID=1203257 RepID=UPI000563E5DF